MFGYDPKTKLYPYPIDTDKHYMPVLKDDGTVFDKNYPFIDKSFSYRFKAFLMHLALTIVAFPVCSMVMGLKILNKKNLKKHKDIIKNGIVSICNHINKWDFISVNKAIFPHTAHILAWDKNMRGENKTFIRYVGGIPVPTNDIRATFAMTQAILNELKNGGWIHINPEGSMWEYYKPIRPFKQGAFYYSVKASKPVLPFGYSFREPHWFQKLIKKPARIVLNVGEPIYPNLLIEDEKERILDLTRRCHEEICKLCFIKPEENIYEPIYNDSKRVDYY